MRENWTISNCVG